MQLDDTLKGKYHNSFEQYKNQTLVRSQKEEPQNDGYKKTKHTKFFEN